jgi:hypothetical protein
MGSPPADYVLDEDGGAWHRVLRARRSVCAERSAVVRSPKYALWIAKAVVFVLEQYNLL